LVCGLPALARGQTKTGTTFGAFLLIEPSARIAGMGNVGSTIAEGLQSVYYNPGAIGNLERVEFVLSHSAWIAELDFNYFAAAVPIGKSGTVVATATTLSSGDIAVRTVQQPLGTGEQYQVTDVAIAAGYGLRISGRLSAGAQVSYVQETIWHSSASAFVLNLGTVYEASPEGIRIGASMTNLGTDASFSGDDLSVTYDADPDRYGDNGTLPAGQSTYSFPVPVMFRFGLGLPRRLSRDTELLLVADAYHPSDNSESLGLGAEVTHKRLLSLRAGWQNLFQTDAEVGLTLGAGLKTRLQAEGVGLGVDYAWADHGRLDDTHRLTLSVDF
jgi:hypothetical protein